MKRGRKIKTETVNLPVLRQELYTKHMNRIRPTIKKNLQIDAVLDEVCHHLVDLEFQDRRLPSSSEEQNDFTRLYDHGTDSYIHIHYKGKNYRFDGKKAAV